MAGINRLNCRMVVLETRFCIGCKSAKMFIVGFCGVNCCCGKHNSTTKALSSQPILAKVLLLVTNNDDLLHMKQTILAAKQSDLLENLIVKHGQIVTSGQIFKEAESYWDYKQAKNLVTKLVKNGWLIRIKRGLYAISDLSTRGFLTLSPYLIANLLVPDSYVSFESALAYNSMFDQLMESNELRNWN
jgi:hypothetical protein